MFERIAQKFAQYASEGRDYLNQEQRKRKGKERKTSKKIIMWIYKSAIYFLVSPMMSSSPFNDQCSRSKNITPLFPPNQPFPELSFREILSRFPKNKPNYLFSAVAAIVCRVVPLPLIVLVSFPFCFRSFRLFLSLCSGSFDVL